MKHTNQHRGAWYLFLFLMLSISLFGQHFNWTNLTTTERISRQWLQPNKYHAFVLDTSALLSTLADAPHETAQDVRSSTTILRLPTPDGETAEFRMVAYDMMEPELKARWSYLRTWRGVNIKQPHVNIRLDWTPRGLHAYVRDGEQTWLIDPYTRENQVQYMSYFRKDYPRPDEAFRCATESSSPTPLGHHSTGLEKSGDCQLRSYRLALACTGEYATFHGGTEADAAAAILTTLNRVNGIFEQDLAIRLILVDNNHQLIYLNGTTDPYNNDSGSAMLNQNQTNCNNVIGYSNYDIGHVFSTGGGSRATLRASCSNQKARGVTGRPMPIGDPFDVDYVAHEMGHQFGANHTQNNDCNRSTVSVEPGSASTIMGYAGICAPNVQSQSDAYFHGVSIQEIANYMQTGGGAACANIISTVNDAPTVGLLDDYTIPHSTPFALKAVNSHDPNGDALSYSWEQYNNEVGAIMPPTATNVEGPMFRSLFPTDSPTRYFPKLRDLAANLTPVWEVLPSVNRDLDFRLTLRDFNGTYGCTTEIENTLTVAAEAGPFVVTSPDATTNWQEGAVVVVNWEVAETDVAPIECASVDILLSTDSGLTYPTVLASDTPNDGSASVVVPVGNTNTARVMVRAHDNVFFDISDHNFSIQTPTAASYTVTAEVPHLATCEGSGNSLTYTLSTSSLAGYSGSIAFSTDQLPNGVVATLSTTDLLPGQPLSLTLTSLDNLSPGNYEFDLVATSSSENIRIPLSFAIEVPPSGTTLMAPQNGSQGVPIFATLDWEAVALADGYFVQIALDANFNDVIHSTSLNTTTYTMTDALRGDTDYYWRVWSASSACGPTTVSAENIFQTEACHYHGSTNIPLAISAGSPANHRSNLLVEEYGTIAELEVINLDITHSRTGDLFVRLVAPNGMPRTLLSFECDNSDDVLVSFKDDASTSMNCPINTGDRIAPDDQLSQLAGTELHGIWSLDIWDGSSGEGGQLNGWGLKFCTNNYQFLPVEWLSFTAQAVEKTIVLDWKTGEEFNNAGFDIERRAAHETAFRPLAWVDAVDYPAVINNYVFIDKSARPGIRYYYRLRQVDYSADESYSPIRSAQIAQPSAKLEVFPNPTKGPLQIQLLGNEQLTDIHISDLQGRTLLSQKLTTPPVSLDLRGFPQGVYLLKAFTNHGILTQKITLLQTD